MGRGRAKAKQTRVARELKYHSPNTDLAALQRELASSGRKPSEEEIAKYGEYLDHDDEEDDAADDEDEPAVGHDPPRRR
jgi:hypothetical protein